MIDVNNVDDLAVLFTVQSTVEEQAHSTVKSSKYWLQSSGSSALCLYVSYPSDPDYEFRVDLEALEAGELEVQPYVTWRNVAWEQGRAFDGVRAFCFFHNRMSVADLDSLIDLYTKVDVKLIPKITRTMIAKAMLNRSDKPIGQAIEHLLVEGAS